MAKKMTTYKDAGVDVEAGYKTVGLIKSHVKQTLTPGVLTELGQFGGLFALDVQRYPQPVLVSGTDGVGTKLMIAFMTDRHDTIGQDCVAMCVNDILCHGAAPLFFLDYIASGKLQPGQVAEVVKGIACACKDVGAALIGGETAEMPGLYQSGEYDVAGFAVGVVNRPDIIDGSRIKANDSLIALTSNGLHSNGFSLVRHILFKQNAYSCDQYIPDFGHTLGEELLRPTALYVKPVLNLIEKVAVHGLCHITGGGFYENIPRMLPKGLWADIDSSTIPKQSIFAFLQELTKIETREMYNTFNMGVGMVLAVPPEQTTQAISILRENKQDAFVLGQVMEGDRKIQIR